MRLQPIRAEDLASIAAFAAPLQARPVDHCPYLAVAPDDIAAELAETTWHRFGLIAYERDGSMLGWLVGDVDDDMGRVWWQGPFVDVDRPVDVVDDAGTARTWEHVADELLGALRAQLAPSVTEEEMCCDACAGRTIAWARGHELVADVASHVLSLPAGDRPHRRANRATGTTIAAAATSATTGTSVTTATTEDPVPGDPTVRADRVGTVRIRPMKPEDHAAVAELHDDLFPGTHTVGARLVADHDSKRPRLVADSDGRVLGYVAVELQVDGTGYIDFVGVAPSARRRGVGAELVRAAVGELRALGAGDVHLTVRDDAVGARDLYTGLGFTFERTVVPLRRGFGSS